MGAETLRLVPTLLTGPALLVPAAFVDAPGRELLWMAAALIDYSGPLLVGTAGWAVAPAYFVERHGQIIIIALGEAIREVGAGAAEVLGRPGVVVAVVLAVLIEAGLWWSYFGYLRGGAERRLSGTGDRERARLARDSYSYLHLPLVAGVVWSTEMATRRRMVGECVEASLVSRALALDTMSNSATRLLGPVLAGSIYQAFGLAGCFSASACVYG